MPLDDGAELFDLTRPFVLRLLEIAWDDAREAGFIDSPFDVENPFVQEFLDDLGLLIRGIAETTRTRVQEIIGDAARVGWGAEEIAARMEEAGLFGIERARTIAVTETARAYSLGSIAAWRASGVVDRMEWLLESDACDVCRSIADNNRIVLLGELFADGIKHPPAHPMCRCALAGVVSDI